MIVIEILIVNDIVIVIAPNCKVEIGVVHFHREQVSPFGGCQLSDTQSQLSGLRNGND